MFRGRIKRTISLVVTAMMLTNLVPAVCYGETLADSEVEMESIVADDSDFASEYVASEPESIEEANREDDVIAAEGSSELETETESETIETETETVTETETESVEVVKKGYVLTTEEDDKKCALADSLDQYINAIGINAGSAKLTIATRDESQNVVISIKVGNKR